jgi:hypothetical protein
MHDWIVYALLGSLAPSLTPGNPTWQNDYHTARQQALELKKPLVVFVGKGSVGWNNVVKEEGIDLKIKQLLAIDYVCLYVDKSTEKGKQLADVFEVTNGSGLVISDRTGAVQAFHHDGELSRQQLTKTLEKFASSDVRVVTTESINPPQPAVRYTTSPNVQPITNSYPGRSISIRSGSS